MAVKVKLTDVTFNGVALSDLKIDELRFFESELTGKIIKNNNDLIFFNEQRNATLAPYCINLIAMYEQQRFFVQAEIENRYNLIVV